LRSSHPYRRRLAVSVLAVGLGIALAPSAAADPGDPYPGPGNEDTSGGDTTTIPVDSADDSSPAVTACHQFGDALDTAAQYYGDFADTIEGQAQPDYGDPTVDSTNATGRTALRQAASDAMSAAGTPGLTPDISDPMRAWSFGATKLLLKMGLHTSGATMNDTATAMNDAAGNAQMACANAGTHA
jgi:hypothetical protein